MKRTVLFICLMCLGLTMTHAQPMSGAYTVGGTAPDFATLQDAAIALFQRGISGPVVINIRPGIYMRDGGNSTVLKLDTLIAGVSTTNRITFQSDAGAGGNADNVVFRLDRTSTSSDLFVVVIHNDYITLRNMTLQHSDSLTTGFIPSLIDFQGIFPVNPVVDGFVLEGCKLIGTPIRFVGGRYVGTDFGLSLSFMVGDCTIRGNTFVRVLRAISSANRGATQGAVVVEDNQFSEGYRSVTGSGNTLGSAIELDCRNPIIRRNRIDYSHSVTSGFLGIYITNQDSSIVERNQIIGPVDYGLYLFENAVTPSLSNLIANNMIGSLFRCHASNSRIVYNSIRAGIPHHWITLEVNKPNCEVVNNIIILFGSPAGPLFPYDQAGASNIQSDYNIIYKYPTAANWVVRAVDGTWYATLQAYQAATGLDSNSVFKDIEFLDYTSDFHLPACQAQDQDLIGIPIAGIVDDFDGDVRSTTRPMKGADEVAQRAVPMWGDVFRIPLPGFITDLAAGSFDNVLGAEGLAIADYTNSQVRLYHNLPSSRSFVLSSILSPGFQPMNVKLFDLDHDGHLDVIVSGDTSLIRIYWGNGLGGFPSDTTVVVTFGFDEHNVVSIDTGQVSTFIGPAMHTILVSSGPATLPPTNFLGYLVNNNGRSIRHETVLRPGTPSRPDSIHGILRDFVGVDIDGDGDPEVAAILTSGVLNDFIAFNDTNAQGGGGWFQFGAHYGYIFGAHSYMKSNSIVAGRFAGGALADFATTSVSELEIGLLRNQGNFTFSHEVIPVNNARGLAAIDYNNDGRLDIVTVNRRLEDNGVTALMNDGAGSFRPEFTCFSRAIGTGLPVAVVASDFDLDGRTDLAVAAINGAGQDTVFVLYNFGGGISHVRDTKTQLPTEFRLEQNYPNPFNPTTTIQYTLPRPARVNLSIYNILGQHVATLVDEVQDAGLKTATFHASNLASGVYFYRLRTAGFTDTKKLLLLK